MLTNRRILMELHGRTQDAPENPELQMGLVCTVEAEVIKNGWANSTAEATGE